MRKNPSSSPWDLTALLNAADPRSTRAERHLWLVRLMEWLRHAPLQKDGGGGAPAAPAAPTTATPRPIVRLKHLFKVLAQHAEHRERVQGVLHAFWEEVDATALFADFGLSPRPALLSELSHRVGQRLLPGTPDTADLAELFPLLFVPGDAEWLQALDDGLLGELAALMSPPAPPVEATTGTGLGTWRGSMASAVTIVVAAIQHTGLIPALRKRMSPELIADEPFRQLARSAQQFRQALQNGEHAAMLQEAQYLRALLDQCRRAGNSITQHLEEHGVSVDMVFAMEQLEARAHRLEELLDCLLSTQPRRDLMRLLAHLLRTLGETSSVRSLMARQYSLLARQVAERNAETGEHYITRDRGEWFDMLRRAAGGGIVIAGTTFLKFAIVALGLTAFWGGFWSGVNYAGSFVLIMLLHWTVATKQPAMTAPAMAAALDDIDEGDEGLENFVDKVVQLIRSQAAGIAGNLMLCAPLVLAVQLLCQLAFGGTPVGADKAEYIKHSITLLGPTPFFAAFTGVLLFSSSLIAGWAENWFVFHRLDSAIAWNPRIVARLGGARAQRWASWWRKNISGLAANVSLGFMLGLVPPLLAFFGLPLDVRHVTLSTGQLAAALGAELPVIGWRALVDPALWWAVAGIAAVGALNLTVSFALAFTVALRSRGIKLRERSRIYGAIRQRLREAPMSFLRPPKAAAD